MCILDNFPLMGIIKPKRLYTGDNVATISLSWGGAAEFPHRYQVGKLQLEKNFGLHVRETRNALRSAKWIYNNPQARADDLMEALEDSSIKAIFSNIGGEDSIRILPFVDLKIIRNNPKIFLGFSDSTVTHFCFYKAGVSSIYGTSVMVGFAENTGMHSYQIQDIKRSLFSSNIIGTIHPNADGWTSEFLVWNNKENQKIARSLNPYTDWRFLQGKGKTKGALLGGCLDVLEFLKDTSVWVNPCDWEGKIMFLETSEAKISPNKLCGMLRNYAASGILKRIKGLLFARPYNNQFWKGYDDVILKVIKEEEGLINLPIISGMDFGHTCPIFSLPYGIEAEIDCDKKIFSIIESALVE